MMDRSNVRESILRQSYVFNTGQTNINRSFISTALVNDSMAYGDDLRKSRIQNLPNYKKNNLGDNLQFIVVFQTIEIERLSQEVEVLRVRLKEYERQLCNAQNYQVQIRQLTEKCFSQEKEIYEYRQEYEKLNKICQTLYHENQMLKNKLNEMDFSLKQKFQSEKAKNADLMQQIQKWKARYQACEKSKGKQLEDLRGMMQSQRKSMIDRQIREMTVRFQTERAGLESEIRKCRQMLENRGRDAEQLRQRCQKHEITIMQLRNYENVIADHESKLVLLNQQLLRLNEILRTKEDDAQAARQREHKLTQQVKEQKEWDYEVKQLRSNLDAKARQAEDWRARVSRLEDQVVRGKQMQHYNEELGNKLGLAGRQLERLNGILKNKLDEIEQWKKRVTDRDAELSRLKNVENQVAGYESKMGGLRIENDRINGILKSRLGQIEEWKGRHNALQSQVNGLANVEKQKRNLQEKCNNQLKINEELKFIVSKLENEMAAAKRNQNQLRDAERASTGLQKQVERLNTLLKSSANELNDFRVRYSKVEGTLAQYRSIENKLRDYEGKVGLLTQELEKLNQLLRERNREIAQLQKEKLELHSKASHYKNYELKISEGEQAIARATEANNALRRQIDNWQAKFREAQGKARQIDSNLFRAAQQKDKLSSMVKSKASQYDQLRVQYSRLQSEIRRKGELEQACQEQHNQIMGLVADIEGYERRLKANEQELEKEKAFSNEFACKIIVLSCEIERLSQQGGASGKAKGKQFVQLQQSYSRLQSKVSAKNSQIDALITKITSLESKIGQITTDFSRLLAEVQKSEQQTRGLARQIEQYQDYASRIHILGAEIDRLRLQNKAFDEDVRKMRLKYSDSIALEKKDQLMALQTFLMAVEIESLRRRIDEREINVEQLRKSILEPVRRI